MSDPFEQGDELKKQYLDKALHANDEALGDAKFTDLLDKDSTVYKDPYAAKREPTLIAEKPKVDADGFPIIEQVHTYKEDLTDIVQSDKLSLSRIAMMNEGVKNTIPANIETPKKDIQSKIFLVLGIVLGIMAIGVIGGVIMKIGAQNQPTETQTQKPKERYIIFAEQNENFDITKSTKTEVTARLLSLKSQFREEDSIMEVIPSIRSSEGSIRVSLNEFFNTLDMRLPDELRRSLGNKFFFGYFSKKGRTEPFLIMYTNSYDIAFPNLLEWEGFTRDDLDWIYDTKPKVGTTSIELKFKDRVIANKDARSLEDSQARTAFFYMFLDEHTILFANTADTVRKVIDRIREAQFQ